MDAADWTETDRLLDDLLDLPPPDRRMRLRRLAERRPELAASLSRALEEEGGESSAFDRFPELLAESADGEELVGRHPERIGAYAIRELLAKGGMGVVYRAERVDGGFEQTVALKVLPRQGASEALRARFVQERQLLARLEHPRIARLLDGGLTADGEPFFAMEYVEGEPIDRHCDRVGADFAERIALFDQVLDAVRFAHQNLVLHRDLKPGNILVTAQGEVKLLDFGIAKLLEGPLDDALTGAEDRWLTPGFASPEQLAGEAVSTRADVYSLGVLLFQLLTGLHPFGQRPGPERRAAMLAGDAPTASAVVRRAAEAAAAATRSTSSRTLAASLRGDLDAILGKATRRDPRQRYDSVEQLQADLERYRTGYPVAAIRGRWLYAGRKLWRRHRIAFAAAALVAISLALGSGVALYQARVARDAEAKAAAINRFLTEELLASASPEVAQGRELTVREVVAAAALNLGPLRDQPEVESSIRRTIADVHLRLGQYDAARDQIEAADRILTATGRSTVERATLRRLAAELALAESDLDRGLALAEEAVALAEAAEGADGRTTLENRLLLGRVQAARWDSIAAEGTFRDVVARLEQSHPESLRLILHAKRNLAEILAQQTRRTEAIALLREILQLQEHALGPEHPDVGRTLRELAGPLARFRFFDEAQSAARRGLSILQAVYGPSHSEAQRARYEVARVLLRARRDDEALVVLEEILELEGERPGEPDRVQVDATNALGVAYYRLGDSEQAVRHYRRALTAAETALGDRHETTAMIRRNLSNGLASIGRHDEAMDLAGRVRRLALDAMEDPKVDPMYLANNAWFLGRGARLEEALDRDAALALARRAVERSGGRWYYPWIALQDAHQARGEIAEAIAASERALELPDALHLVGDEALLVTMLTGEGDLKGAETFLREHLERRRVHRGGEDYLAGHTRGLLGRVLLAQGRIDDAAAELEVALRLLHGDDEDMPLFVARARSDLGATLAEKGELESARPHLLRAVESLGEPSIWRQYWGEEHQLAVDRLAEVSERLSIGAGASRP